MLHPSIIEEYTKRKITEYKEREINKLTYQVNISDKKQKKEKLYIISIMDMAEQESILERFKRI